MRAAQRVLAAHEEKLPEVGKYNAGQKMVFWLMSVLIIILIGSGLVIWDQYFGRDLDREAADRVLDPCARGHRDHLRVDRSRLCRDLARGTIRAMTHGRSPAAGRGAITGNGCGSWPAATDRAKPAE